MDLNSFAQNRAFLSQLNFLHTLRIRSKVWETVGTRGTKDDEPPATTGSRSGHIESSPECAAAKWSGFKSN